jgi:hypothetical protein
MPHENGRRRLVLVLRLLALTLPAYFAWEMLQAPAFTGMPKGWLQATAVCGASHGCSRARADTDARSLLAPSLGDPSGRNVVFRVGASLTPGSARFTGAKANSGIAIALELGGVAMSCRCCLATETT